MDFLLWPRCSEVQSKHLGPYCLHCLLQLVSFLLTVLNSGDSETDTARQIVTAFRTQRVINIEMVLRLVT